MSTPANSRLIRRARMGFGLTGLAAAGTGAALAIGVGASPVVFAIKATVIPLALAAMVWKALPRHLPHDRLGPANVVTLARSLPVACLAALAGAPAAFDHPGLVSMLAVITIILDAVDGLVARHKKMVSEFGAALDGELDALLVLVLTIAVWQLDRAGAWVLLAGSARFLFLAAMWRWRWLDAPLPPSNHRKLCFGFLVWSLAAVPSPMLSAETGWVLSFFATALLILSFTVDVAWLHARHTGSVATREDLPPEQPGGLAWGRILAAAAGTAPLVPMANAADQQLLDRFQPLLPLHPDRPKVVGHLAQSLDGHIALDCGASQWISGPEDILHTHRLRAIVDAVMVGVETAIRDDPRLTVREAEGSNPLRVVLDPKGRLMPDCHLCQDDSAPTLVLTRHVAVPDSGRLGLARVRGVDDADGHIHPRDILDILAEEGARRVLVEGGGVTVTKFIEAGCMDRLHLMVSPVLLGDGRAALHLPAVATLDEAMRPPCRVEQLGDDVLFDIDLSNPANADLSTLLAR
jgi:riboflavin-specific deaminase-like protein